MAFAAAPDLPYALALLKGAWSALSTGYVANTGVAMLDEILTRGGMSSMMTTVWLIITALSFGAVVEHPGLLNRLIDPLVKRVKSVAGLVATTGLRHRHQYHGLGSVHRHRSARPTIRAGFL